MNLLVGATRTPTRTRTESLGRMGLTAALVLAVGTIAAGCSDKQRSSTSAAATAEAARRVDKGKPDGKGPDGVRPPNVSDIQVASGANQMGTVGQPLAQPFVIQVFNKKGLALPNEPVTFAVAAGGGTLSVTETTTDAQGQAQSLLTLGAQAGTQMVTATAGRVTITIVASAVAAPADSVVAAAGQEQTGVAGAPLAQPFVVLVQDANKQPKQGATIAFAVKTGAGTLSAASATTDATGRASTLLTLDPKAGLNEVTASLAGAAGSPVTFKAFGTAGAAAALAIADGDMQTGVTGQKLAKPLIVLVTDANANPVANANVAFVVAAGGGTLSAATAASNAQGMASSELTLGAVGANTVTATVQGLTPVTFTASAVAAPATAITIVSGDMQTGTAGAALAAPLVVRVTDANNNPVSGFMVQFAVASGGGALSAATAATNAQGQASSTLTLGALAGANSVTAGGSGLTPVTFQSLGVAGPAAALTLTSGTNQTGEVGKALAQPFVVTVSDANANPVQNVPVTFAVATGGGSLSATQVASAANGTAMATLTLGPAAGANTVTATVAGLPVATFTAMGVVAPPTAIALTSGNNQTGTAGAALAQPFVVTVTDANNQPVQGFMVGFTVAAGGGSLTAATVATNAQGQASTTLTLGTTAGPNNVTATAAGLTGSPITFAATGNPGPAAAMTIASGNNQTAAINMALAQPLVVKIADANGNPVAGTSVMWQVQAGGGTLSAASSVSGDDGLTSVMYAVGPQVVANSVTASAAGLAGSPATFTATATAAAATTIAAQAGNNQTGVAGSALASPFVVKVTDAGNNPVANVAVTFAVAQGGGALDVTSAQTNAMGFAMATLTLGTTAGPNMITASANGLTGSPLTFAATGTAGPAAKLAIASGNNQSGEAGKALAQPLVVKVSDANDNPVAGTQVVFEVSAGGGTATPVAATSGPDGLAQTSLTLGAAPATNTVVASSQGLTSVTFTATGMAATPTQIALTSGNNQTGVAGAPLAQPFAVTVRDANNSPVQNFMVSFAVATGGGTLSAATAATNAQGVASTTLTLGAAAGTNTVTANATGLMGSPITFTALGNAGPAATIALTSGNNQSGIAGSALAQPFVVTVTDANANPVSGHTISWTVAAGGGTLSAASSTTGATGQASTTLTLGAAPATHTVTANSAGLTGSPVTFSATGMAAPPAAVSIVSGDAQSAQIGTALANPLVVRVTDANNNPVSGVAVSFAAATGGGAVNPTSAMTNAQGQASTALTVGTTLGANTVTATVQGLTPATFTAMATALNFGDDIMPILTSRCTLCHAPGGVMAVRPFQTYAQVREGISLLGLPYVIPFDPANSVFAQKVAAGGTMAPYLTVDQAQTISAWINTGALEGAAQVPTTLAIDSGDMQTAPANTALAMPLVAKVTDANNLPVAMAELVWTVSAGGGTLALTNGGATDLLGQAMATLTLGPTAGASNTVTVTAPGIPGATITFTATAQAGANTSVLTGSTNPLDVAALSAFMANNVISAPLSSDDEFIRRVTGDLIGRLPSATELAAFEADNAADKRARLIDALLASGEFLDHWTNIVAVWCETDPTETETVNNVDVTYQFDAELRADLSNGATLNDILRKLITSTGDVGNAFRDDNSGNNLSSGTDVLATAFLGMSVHCGRCHDHKLTTPNDNPRWTQSEVYGLYAYMSTSSRYGSPRWVADGTANQVTGPAYAGDNLAQRRTALADTWTQSPAYYRATSHRIWSEIATPLLNVNEFLAANLAAVRNQPLLQALADTFASQNTSLQGFLRVAMNSKLYQLSSAFSSTAGDAFQARYQLRRNHAEVIERGLHQIADVTYRSDSIFRANFLAAERDSINTRDGDSTSIDQSLMLLNSSRARAITDSGTQLVGLANDVNNNVMTYEQAATVLVRAALSRDPNAAELAAISAERDPNNTRASLEDVAVGLGASAEFVFRR